MSNINDIKKLRYSGDIDMKLAKFGTALSENYCKSALLEIVMEYFALCEMISESLNPELQNAADELDVIHTSVKKISSGESVAGDIEEFKRVRGIITDKMNLVTAYVDRFLVFEYIMDRLAPSYNMSESELEAEYKAFDATSYTRDLLQYIFASEDNMIVNERLHEVLEFLPVRMSRKKYLGLVESGLGLYEESDKASFDEYIYMLRTSSMLYECKSGIAGFEAFEDLFEELMAVDYSSMDVGYYNIVSDKLYNVTVSLGNLSDVYMCLQKIINMLYVYALNDTAIIEESDFSQICTETLKSLYEIVCDDKKELASAEEGLIKLEGYMEKLYEEREVLVPLTGDMELTYDTKIHELGLSDCYMKLSMSERLMNGLFASVEPSVYEAVTTDYVFAETERLLAELEALFKNSSRYIVRAVIALTMGKLPMPFASADDVKDYILNSFEHCSDKSEIVAVKNMVDGVVVNC